MSISKLLPVALALVAGAALAQDYRLKDLTIDHPYARATPPGAKSGAAFLTVGNKGTTADKLVDASTPAAKIVEIHEMWMDGGVMKMRAVAGVDVKPGGKAELKPGGYHIMLLDLKAPLKAGDKVPLTLVFEKAGKIQVSVQVEDMAAAAALHKH
jgi:periplasmic copper chaperone A